MKAKLTAIIIALICSTAATAQEGTQDFKDEVLSTRSRADVQAELAQARAAGQLDTRGDTYGSFDAREAESTLTRAEVLADLQIWRESGLAALSRGEAGYNVFTLAYRQAQARYRALRASPRYAELVQRIAQERGENVASRSVGTTAQ
jgi:hypothetical protein